MARPNGHGWMDGPRDEGHALARQLLMQLRMINLPPIGPLATAGAPVASTLLVIGWPAVVAAGLAFGTFAGALCAAALLARRGKRRVVAPREARTPQLQVPYAPMERA